jgi:cyanophycinase
MKLILILSYSVLMFAINLTALAQGYICAIGGGSEDYGDWSDEPYGWIVHKSDSGKMIIISDADATNWIPDYFLSLGSTEAYNKKIESRVVADMQSTYDELITAKAIFIKGGDQWNYISLWKGTKTEQAIYYVFQNGGVIAGTSAGAAVLGDLDYSAKYGSAYPRSSLINPLQSNLDFEDDFLVLQPNVIFDSHFVERGRFGRLIPMIYKIEKELGRDIIGAGIDDRTALCITPDGIAEVMGSAAVSFFYQDNLTNFTDYQNNLYTIENLKCDQLTRGWKFNLNTREIEFIPSSAKQVDTSKIWQYPISDFTLTGSDNITNQLNESFSNFVSGILNPQIVIFTHQTFSTQAQEILSYLNQQQIDNSIIYLNQSSINNSEYVQTINNANAFGFAGDSLLALSLLNQTSDLVPQAFYDKITSNTPCYFFGNAGKVSGEFFVDNTDIDYYASYRGKMTNEDGINLFGELLFQPLLFDDDDFYENRTSSLIWGMMRNRKRVGIYLDVDPVVDFISETNSINGYGSIPWIVVDARNTTFVDSSTYMASGGIAPRQVAAMNNLRFSLTKYSGINYLLGTGRFDNLVSVEKKTEEFLNEFILEQNYPNPFNPTTKIKFTIPAAGFISLKVFDFIGRQVAELANGYFGLGTYNVNFDGSGLSSGVYFYQLKTNNYSETKSMMLLK